MGSAPHLIARLYGVEERARTLSLSAEQRLALRQRVSVRLLSKLHQYLLELAAGSPAEESIRRRGNWTFFGSDGGGKTAAVLRSFMASCKASCKRCGVEPFAWFHDERIAFPQLEDSPRLSDPLIAQTEIDAERDRALEEARNQQADSEIRR